MVRLRLPLHLPPKKYGLVICGVIAVGSTVTALYLFSRPGADTIAPTYDIVLPQRTSVEDLGGWRRVSPAGNDPVFAYDDTIDTTSIRVSQQPIPASFTDNVSERVKQVAEGFNATTTIDASGTTVYLGRSARGPQYAIFTKNTTLVLIKSQKTLSQAVWIKYINNLVDPKTEQTPTF